MKIALVYALQVNADADHFHDGYRYEFTGVVDAVAGEAMGHIVAPSGLPGWIASQLAGYRMFKIQSVELGGLGEVGGYVERVLNNIEREARHD